MAAPPTRILSWMQLCLEADPNYQRGLTQPWLYEMSNGRLFYQPNPLYAGYGDFLQFDLPGAPVMELDEGVGPYVGQTLPVNTD